MVSNLLNMICFIIQLLYKIAYIWIFFKNLTQFYINFSRLEHQIDVLYISFNAWYSKVSSYTFNWLNIFKGNLFYVVYVPGRLIKGIYIIILVPRIYLYICIYKVSLGVRLSVCMSDHNAWTPRLICLKLCLENSVEPRKCFCLGLTEWIDIYKKNVVSRVSWVSKLI